MFVKCNQYGNQQNGLIMRKIFFIISIIFLYGTICVAQNIKQDDFDKIVDYVNCRYAKAYMENTNASPSDKDAYNNIIKPQLENCSLENHLPYTDLYNLLSKNSWTKTANSLIKSRKDSKKFVDISSKTDPEIIEYIIDISGTFQTTIGYDLINQIEAELKEKYTSKPQDVPVVVEETTEITSPPIQVPVVNKSDSHWLMWLIILLETILLFVFAYFLYRLWERFKKFKKVDTKDDVEDKSSDVKIFEDKLRQLERRQGELEEKVRNFNFEPSNQNTTETKEESAKKPTNAQARISKIKFFRTKNERTLQEELPNESGASFKIFDINNDEAKFEYCGGVMNPDFFVEICTFENNPADVPHKKEIRTISSGTVKKDNYNWVVNKPAKIKFV